MLGDIVMHKYKFNEHITACFPPVHVSQIVKDNLGYPHAKLYFQIMSLLPWIYLNFVHISPVLFYHASLIPPNSVLIAVCYFSKDNCE